MVLNQKENELHVYPINENECIGAINATVGGTDTYRIIVVLDSSLPVATRIAKEILPLVMSRVKNWHPSVRLFTFGDESIETYLSKTELSTMTLTCGGAPKIAPAIEKLRLFLETSPAYSKDMFDLLTISAGEICDRENAEQETKKLVDLLAKRGWRINSQAVRLFTTSNQPDTKALCYLLQLNNSTVANICDIDMGSTSTNETIADAIAALFPENDFRYTFLDVHKYINLRYPWTSFQWNIYIATKGWNIFWLRQMPEAGVVKIQDQPLTVVTEGQLTLEKFQQLMEKKLPQIVAQMAILKIVGTAEANETVDQMFSYFMKTEDALAMKCSTPNTKVVTTALAEIAMFKPDFRDSTEMSEFHRNPIRAIEDRKEKDRVQREEEERLKRLENERHKQEEDARIKMDEEKQRELERQEEEKLEREKQLELEREKQLELEREKQLELERGKQLELVREKQLELERGKQLELEREKQLELERGKQLELEREKQLELEREKQQEVERQKEQEGSPRLKRDDNGYLQEVDYERMEREKAQRAKQDDERRLTEEEVITARGVGKSVPNNDRSSIQAVFIIYEHRSGAYISRRFTEQIVPLMLSKFFHGNVQLVTFLRYKTTAAQTIQSLVQTLDATKRIRISVLTNDEAGQQQEVENFAEMVIEFLSQCGYSVELQVVKLAESTSTTNGSKLVDIDGSESNDLTGKSAA